MVSTMPLLLSTRISTGTGCFSGVSPATAMAQKTAIVLATAATVQARRADFSARCARSSSQLCASARYCSTAGSRCICVSGLRRADVDWHEGTVALRWRRWLAGAGGQQGDEQGGGKHPHIGPSGASPLLPTRAWHYSLTRD